MEVDENGENFVKQRTLKLGFKPQNEIVYNNLLPFASALDEESQQTLETIKKNFSSSVIFRDLRLGLSFWCQQLVTYIGLYGFKFSKEDHVYFIKVLYNLLETENLEICAIDSICNTLSILLSKPYLLSKEDVQLNWKTLYDLFYRLKHSKSARLDLLIVPEKTKVIVKDLVKYSRRYFDLKATKSILNELRPYLCPSDMTMTSSTEGLETFLPFCAYTQEEREQSWMLWKKEFVSLWLSIKSGPRWERKFTVLLSRLAEHNIGFIDWSECVQPLFNRISRGFQLPVGKLLLTYAFSDKMPLEASSRWLVSMLGSENTSGLVLKNLENLYKSIETFFHPNNTGTWLSSLLNFTYWFCDQLTKRLFRERYDTQNWKPLIPNDHKLKDIEIEKIVTVIKPVAFFSLYNKSAYSMSVHILQMLNNFRPDLIVPVIMEKTYVASDSITEPLHFRACLLALSHTLIQSIGKYTEIHKHVVPLLIGCLPGIDSNDLPKTIATYKLINSIMLVVPVADCSKAAHYHKNLSADEHEVCMATAQFEDFVVQLFDRSLVLLDSLQNDGDNNADQQPILQMETAYKNFIATSASLVLYQSSSTIVLRQLKHLFQYSTTHLYDGKAALSAFASLASSCARVDPKTALSMFVPYYCKKVIEDCEEFTELSHDHKLGKQLVWDLKILTEFVKVGTDELLQYKNQVYEVAQKVLVLNNKEAYKAAGKLVSCFIKELLRFGFNDRCSLNSSKKHNEESYLALKDWGKKDHVEKVEIDWHVPKLEDFEACFEAVDMFLLPTLKILDNWAVNNSLQKDLTKKDIENYLQFCNTIFTPLSSILPFEKETWDNCDAESPVKFEFHKMEENIYKFLGFYKAYMSQNNCQNLRYFVFKTIQKVMNKLLIDREDDVQSLQQIISIYGSCAGFYDSLKRSINDHLKHYHSLKNSVKDFSKPKKHHERLVILERLKIQVQLRMGSLERLHYTKMHHEIMLDLINLSVSKYAKVRSSAQARFFMGLQEFPLNMYQVYLPIILKYLSPDNNSSHDQYKGALYLLLGKSSCRMTLGFFLRWEVIRQVWPAILKAPHSDKPSIIRLSTKLIKRISENFCTIILNQTIPEKVLNLCSSFLSKSCKYTKEKLESINEEGKKFEVSRNEKYHEVYYSLVNELVELYKTTKMTYRLNEALLDMLSDLIRDDITLPTTMIKIFAENLCNESLGIRFIALSSMIGILRVIKNKKKTEIKTPQQLNIKVNNSVVFGARPDNIWLTYDGETKFDTKSKYDSAVFLDKTYIGYYSWPTKIKTYTPLSDEEILFKKLSEMSTSEEVIVNLFMDQNFVKKFVEYFSIEREVTKCMYSFKIAALFRKLFKNYGDMFLNMFKPHIEKLLKGSQHSQRFAAEFLGGLVGGSKHWNYDMISNLKSWISPILTEAIYNISSETVEDWDNAFQEMVRDRDPRRVYWIIDLAFNEIRKPFSSALVNGARLKILQGVLNQQQWRVPNVIKKTIAVLKGSFCDQYRSGRLSVGELLGTVYQFDVKLQGKSQMVSKVFYYYYTFFSFGKISFLKRNAPIYYSFLICKNYILWMLFN